MRLAAFNTGPDFHLLDHIAPLAASLQIPLFIQEEKNLSLARKYYPHVETHYILDIDLSYFAHHFDALFECKYWLPHLKKLFLDLFRKEMKLIFCAHGQSDKGYAAPLLAPYSYHDLNLVYGPLLQQMLHELGISAPTFSTGNYRLSDYLRHQNFYDTLADREVFSHLPKNKTLLYAPTWNDADHATTFFQSIPALLSSLPSHWNLLVKVHPLLEQREPAHYYRIAALLEKTPRTHLVSEFPLVYPILARADAYLGDASSVGYDYLFFQRPMFFLRSHGKLTTCGTYIKTLSSLLDQPNAYTDQQKLLYQHAFGIETLLTRERILSRLQEAK